MKSLKNREEGDSTELNSTTQWDGFSFKEKENVALQKFVYFGCYSFWRRRPWVKWSGVRCVVDAVVVDMTSPPPFQRYSLAMCCLISRTRLREERENNTIFWVTLNEELSTVTSVKLHVFEFQLLKASNVHFECWCVQLQTLVFSSSSRELKKHLVHSDPFNVFC